MPNIDDLYIEISSNSKKADKSIDNLVSKLGLLSNSLSKLNTSNLTAFSVGVQQLSVAMQGLKNVQLPDYTRLAKGIEKIGAINPATISASGQSIGQLANSLKALDSVNINDNAVQIVDFAKSISRLGYKNVTSAINNIPLLATSLRDLIKTLSTAPQVNQNLIDMTNALANLSAQGTKVGSTSRTMVYGLNNYSASANRASKSTFSLASAFGKFYASYFLVMRGIRGLWGSIESTADYIEAYNYYTVSFGKIASEWDKDWEKYGYENANAYSQSFTDRMEIMLQKMSGVQVSEEQGLLLSSGVKNLGLNIQEITQYASQLASVTNSLGQTGEASLAITKSMTMLSGDISSLFNVDYSDVASNLQSGLIGQSRALYKYGIDITNATLQTYAYEIGLEKAVSEMTQAEKQQLRLLAILDQSRVSWGDLANTIDSPNNQLRMLKNNLAEAGMMLGQLFVPVLENALPVVNGLVIAFKRLIEEIALFFNIQIDLSDYGQGYNEMESDVDDLTDSYEDANNALKEWKNQLLGFDEVTKLNEQSDTGLSTGNLQNSIDLTKEILEATAEYERVWNKAYANMENRAEEIADSIQESFLKIKDSISPYTDAIKDFFEVFKNADIDIIIGFFDGMKSVFSVIGGLAEATLETATFFLGDVFKVFRDTDDEKIRTIGEALGIVAGSFLMFKAGSKALTAAQNLYLLLGKYKALGNIIVGVTVAITAFNLAQDVMDWLAPEWAKETEGMSFGDQMSEIISSFSDGSGKEAVELFWQDVKDGYVLGWQSVVDWWNSSIVEWWNNDVKPWFTKEKWKELWDDVKTAWITGWNVNVVSKWEETGIPHWWENHVKPWFTKEKWKELWDDVKDGFSSGWNGIKYYWNNNAISKWWKEDVNPWFTKERWSSVFSGISTGMKNAWNNAITGMKTAWNAFADWVNEKLTWTIPELKIAGKTLISKTVVDLGFVPKFDIPGYYTGGFPEDGLFMANHGELVGKFANGKTAVANNYQITDGIADAVYPAVYNAITNAMNSNGGNVTVVLQGDANKLFRVVQSQANNYTRQTGQPAFIT